MKSLISFGIVSISCGILGLAAHSCSAGLQSFFGGAGISLLLSSLVWLFLYGLLRKQWRGYAKRGFALVILATAVVNIGSVWVYKASNGTCYVYGDWDDDYRFDQLALFVVESNAFGYRDSVEAAIRAGSGTFNYSVNYSVGISYLYRALDWAEFPPNPAYPRIVNVVSHAFCSVLIFAAAISAGLGLRASKVAMYLTGFSPVLLFNAVNTYRDAILTAGIVATLLCANQLARRTMPEMFKAKGQVTGIILGIGGMLAAALLRMGYMLFIPALLAGAVVLTVSRRYRWPVLAVLAGALVGGFLLVDMAPRLAGIEGTYISEFHAWNAERISRGGDSRFLTLVYSLQEPLAFMARMVIRNVYPLPVFPQGKVTPDLFYQLATVEWLVLIPFIAKGARHAFSSREWNTAVGLRIAALFMLGFFIISAWGTMQSRHVATYFPAAALLAARGSAGRFNSCDGWVAGVSWIAVGAVLLYGFFC